jgi:hypothetical protein
MSSGWAELNEDLFWPDLTLTALEEDLVRIADVDVKLSPLAKPTELNDVRQTLADTQFLACCLKFDALKIVAAFSTEPLPPSALSLDLPSELSGSTIPVMKAVILGVRVDENQNRKDITRDHLSLNGKYHRGSDLGYDNLIIALTECLGGDRDLAVRAVSVGCRTFSVGISLETVMDAFAYGDYVVVPESAQAQPVDFLSSHCSLLIRAHTRYSLRSSTDAEVVDGLVDAVFLCDFHQGRAAVHLDVLDP